MKISKSQVRKAGDIYRNYRIDNSITKEEYAKALEIITIFRSQHQTALDTILQTIDNSLKKLKIDNAIVAHRLKRSISIEKKLKRFPKMSLDRMQDIAGCRIIVKNYKDLRKLQKEFRDKFTLRHNYIKHPKDDGYRSIHYTTKIDGYFVEIQIRTQIQHAWATALEIVDIFEKKSLKTKEDIEDSTSKLWMEFFRVCSTIFQQYEFKDNLDYNELKKLFYYYNRLKIEKKFSAYKELPPLKNKTLSKKDGYYLVLIDLFNREAKYFSFEKNSFKEAIDNYQALEELYSTNPDIVVSLVAVEDLNNIKLAYPNFFADSQKFLELLKILEHIYKIEKESRGIVAIAVDFALNLIKKS